MEKLSFLKHKTRNDIINELSAEEKAVEIIKVFNARPDMKCNYCARKHCDEINVSEITCVNGITAWLESEVK